MLIYSLALIFAFIPLTALAYFRVSKSKPLNILQNNMVVSALKFRRSMGVWYTVVFWTFHGLMFLAALYIEAPLSAVAIAVYVVFKQLLLKELKEKQYGVIPQVAVPTQGA